MKLIAGLGNPGNIYAKTRHNIGSIIGIEFAGFKSIPVKKKMFSSITGTGLIDTQDVCILLPQTFMNVSGEAVSAALNYYKLKPDDLIVIHDEIELSFGNFKTKFGGGHKGHNGLRSIIQHVGSGDFHRLRFGVGRPQDPRISVADYVLANFLPEEITTISDTLPAVYDMLMTLIQNNT